VCYFTWIGYQVNPAAFSRGCVSYLCKPGDAVVPAALVQLVREGDTRTATQTLQASAQLRITATTDMPRVSCDVSTSCTLVTRSPSLLFKDRQLKPD
jgi:hypothetical protein